MLSWNRSLHGARLVYLFFVVFYFYVQSSYSTRSASSLKLHSCTSCACTYAFVFHKPRYTLRLRKIWFVLCCKLPCLVTTYLRVFWVPREHRTCYTSERYHRAIVRYVHKKSTSYPICELKKKQELQFLDRNIKKARENRALTTQRITSTAHRFSIKWLRRSSLTAARTLECFATRRGSRHLAAFLEVDTGSSVYRNSGRTFSFLFCPRYVRTFIKKWSALRRIRLHFFEWSDHSSKTLVHQS